MHDGARLLVKLVPWYHGCMSNPSDDYSLRGAQPTYALAGGQPSSVVSAPLEPCATAGVHAMSCRLPEDVYEALFQKAHSDRTSMNQLLVQGARIVLNLPDEAIAKLLDGWQVTVRG